MISPTLTLTITITNTVILTITITLILTSQVVSNNPLSSQLVNVTCRFAASFFHPYISFSLSPPLLLPLVLVFALVFMFYLRLYLTIVFWLARRSFAIVLVIVCLAIDCLGDSLGDPSIVLEIFPTLSLAIPEHQIICFIFFFVLFHLPSYSTPFALALTLTLTLTLNPNPKTLNPNP